MKTVQLVMFFLGMAVLVAVGSPRAWAQSDVDPDHYEIRDSGACAASGDERLWSSCENTLRG
ncbi:MAG: hypothetical protein WBE44_20030 [Terriglobales bacterium]